VESKRLDTKCKRREQLKKDFRRKRNRAGKRYDSSIYISLQAV